MSYKLFCFVLGCRLKQRNVEQHDVAFVIAEDIFHTVPALKKFWPEAGDRLHIDCWREVTCVDNYKIEISLRNDSTIKGDENLSLFFINLGGYKKEEFDEFHYKCIIVANDNTEAIHKSKESAFFIHTGFAGAKSHIDDKFGIDVDDIYKIEEILSSNDKLKYKINITAASAEKDILHIGYLSLSKLEKLKLDTE